MNKATQHKILERLGYMELAELRRLFTRLAEDRDVLQQVFDTLKDGVIIIGEGGVPSFANRAACEIYGRTHGALMKVPFEMLVGGTCCWEDIQGSGVAINRDLQVTYPAPRHYNFLITPMEKGKRYLLLIHDDTEQQARGRENTEAGQLDVIAYMASAVAHEIGNPLNSLGLNLQLLQRKVSRLEDEAQEPLQPLLQSALKEANRLDVLLRQFLQSMRPAPLQRSKVNLNALLEEVLSLLEPEIAPRGISVRQDFCAELPELNADAEQLFRAFYNLIRNAYQSIPGEGDILLQTDYNDNVVRVQVVDSGTGIPSEVMGNMYEPFRTTKKKGTGLGLLIVRRIIRDHAGTLSFASKEGEGTQVTVTLPRADKVVRLLPN